MTFSKKIIFIALIGLMTACSAQNTAPAMKAQQCCHHKGQDCCKDGCDKCQKCAQTNCECVQCQSDNQSATDLLLNKQSSEIKCEYHK